ncbi:MAG: histidine triad nucleotide-binding protein [Alphaproteobacteria bacterium]|nr:histidine triad nucleotide-binding protein [Alphaproteobacteria bacterium]
MSYDNQNVFAKILRGEIPTNKIYEDKYVIAFPDIHPKAPTHVLVVPKNAYVDFNDLMENASSEEVNGIFAAVKKVAEQLDVIDAGYRLIMNVGPGAGQEVPHLHIHILSNKGA